MKDRSARVFASIHHQRGSRSDVGLEMSGGPPHHSHNRQPPPGGNAAWNHLQVPNYFPRSQPQHAHMSNEHPHMHQAPTWHTPTTEPLKTSIQPSHIFNLEQMLSERPFPRHSPGVDLSVTRNGSQNGDIPAAPISLSVRDTNKINSLAASALEIQGNELKSLSPGLKSSSPGLKSASPSLAPEKSPKSTKKAKRVDSILERLNPQTPVVEPSPQLQHHLHHHHHNHQQQHHPEEKSVPVQSSVIVQASSSHDENSNSSSIRREDEVVSPYSNEDSLDSNKSRRKRKPSKTIRVAATSKEPEATEPPPPKTVDLPPPVEEELERPVIAETPKDVENEKKIPERRKSESPVARKTRRKTSSESETIDKIAAMVQETAKKPETPPPTTTTTTVMLSTTTTTSTTTTSMMTSNVTMTMTCSTAATTPTSDVVRKDFVGDGLEEMFAGLEDAEGLEAALSANASAAVVGGDSADDPKSANFDLNILAIAPSTSHDNVTSTSGDVNAGGSKKQRNQKKRKLSSGKRTDKKKKVPKRNLVNKVVEVTPKKIQNSKKVNGKAKIEVIKDVYAYDSGSNASSSKSRGPFVQIRGPRDSPLSVSVINTPANEDESDRKGGSKSKKFHDDSEYRHKVRSKGLHCSTLSNKYDAQTKDATWICVFCKRGPYSNEFSRGEVGFYTPGDLFGPYVISSNCAEFERRLEDPYDKQFKSKKVCRTLDGLVSPRASTAAAGASTGATTKKKSRKVSENNEDVVGGSGLGGAAGGSDMLGITQMDEKSYEIWAHEDCVVWAPGIYLVGPKIVGLEEAVWTSSNVGCSRCHLKGANICCLRRGCPSVVHLGCAVLLNWQLDEDNYKAYCVEHRV